jgi:hypothetical protein
MRLARQVGGLAEDPENLGDLSLGEADLDVVHAGTIRQPDGWNVVPSGAFEWRLCKFFPTLITQRLGSS